MHRSALLLSLLCVLPGLVSAYGAHGHGFGIPQSHHPRVDQHESGPGQGLEARVEERDQVFEGYRSVGYFTNWVVYEPRNYLVNKIPVDQYTHILYSFGNMKDDGTVFLSDDWADTKLPYGGAFAPEGDLGGNLKELYLMKKQNRHLKTMLSIGGWSYRQVFERIVDPAWRAKFVETSIKLILDLGMDGLDIDYEWANEKSKDGTASLMVELREALDRAASEIGASRLLLSYAAPCTVAFKQLDISKMDAALDFWNLMAYEFSGGHTTYTRPSANLFDDPSPRTSAISGKRCVDYYIKQGATARKFNLGVPLYAAAWNGTEGMYSAWTGRGEGDYNTPGFYDVRSLPLADETVYYDESLGASWSYNAQTTHLTSFDIPQVSLQKTKYVIDNQLGGMMWWAIDEDYDMPSQSTSPAKRSGKAKRQLKKKNKKRNCTRKNPGPALATGNLAAAPNGTASPSASALSMVSASASVSSYSVAPVQGNTTFPLPNGNNTNSTIGQNTSTTTPPAISPNSSISSLPTSFSASASASTPTSSSSSGSSSSSSSSASASVSATKPSNNASNPFASSNPHSTSELKTSLDGIDISLKRSLVQVSKEAVEKYAKEGVDKSENVLRYPSSQYNNVRAGMA